MKRSFGHGERPGQAATRHRAKLPRLSAAAVGVLLLLGGLQASQSAFAQTPAQTWQWTQRSITSRQAQEWTAQAAHRAAMQRANRSWQPSSGWMRQPSGPWQRPQAWTYQEQPVRAGDKIATIYTSTPLMDGANALLTLDAGLELVVRETRGDWVLVAVERDGRQTVGWLYRQHVAAVLRGR